MYQRVSDSSSMRFPSRNVSDLERLVEIGLRVSRDADQRRAAEREDEPVREQDLDASAHADEVCHDREHAEKPKLAGPDRLAAEEGGGEGCGSEERACAAPEVSKPALLLLDRLKREVEARFSQRRWHALNVSGQAAYSSRSPPQVQRGDPVAWRPSGSMSAPFGQTIVPSSLSAATWRKSSRSRSGPNTGPQRSGSRSTSRVVPSLNASRRT